jgi:hypothetical protein
LTAAAGVAAPLFVLPLRATEAPAPAPARTTAATAASERRAPSPKRFGPLSEPPPAGKMSLSDDAGDQAEGDAAAAGASGRLVEAPPGSPGHSLPSGICSYRALLPGGQHCSSACQGKTGAFARVTSFTHPSRVLPRPCSTPAQHQPKGERPDRLCHLLRPHPADPHPADPHPANPHPANPHPAEERRWAPDMLLVGRAHGSEGLLARRPSAAFRKVTTVLWEHASTTVTNISFSEPKSWAILAGDDSVVRRAPRSAPCQP